MLNQETQERIDREAMIYAIVNPLDISSRDYDGKLYTGYIDGAMGYAELCQKLESLLKEKEVDFHEAERKAAKYKEVSQQLEEALEDIKSLPVGIDRIQGIMDMKDIAKAALAKYRNNLK